MTDPIYLLAVLGATATIALRVHGLVQFSVECRTYPRRQRSTLYSRPPLNRR